MRTKFDGDFVIDYTAKEVYFKGELIPLLPREFEIVELLSSYPGQLFSKERIFEHIWDIDCDADVGVVMEHVSKIRAKFASYDRSQGDVQYSYDFDFHYEDYNAEDMRLYRITRFIESYAALFWYSVCIASAGIVFYLTKLKRPIRILNNASQRISENELDFMAEYPGSDEMAVLCGAFETMRSALEESNGKIFGKRDFGNGADNVLPCETIRTVCG